MGMSLSPALLTPSSMSVAEQEEMSLIQKYISSASSDEITLPTITNIDIPSLLLMQRDNNAHKMDTDEYYILDDPKVHGKSKMKKAFCEPGNIKFCPPIVLSMALGPPEVVIKRSSENGGDVTC